MMLLARQCAGLAACRAFMRLVRDYDVAIPRSLR